MKVSRLGPARVSVEEGLRHLVQSAKSVLSELETDRLLSVLMDRAIDLTRADRGLLMLAEDGELKVRAARQIGVDSDDDEGLVISRSVAEEVFRTGRAILSTNVAGDDAVRDRKSVLELRLQTLMCAPLVAGDRTLGVLYVDGSQVRTTFDKNSLTVFTALADLAAIALENARLYALATTDPKTGLANSSLLRARLESAVALAGRGHSVGLVLVDLDHFKRINDSHGHPAGDEVLDQIADILRASVRASDLAARYGGEEFVLLLSSAPDEPFDAVGVAERVRRSIAEHPFRVAGGGVLEVTASLGVATCDEAGLCDPDRLLATADGRLYEAKNAGRDRVVSAAAAPSPALV